MKMEQIPKNSSLNPILKYSGLGIQMAITICVLAWLGHWLDHYFEFKKPILTLFFLLLGTCGSIFSLIKQLK
ncbi:MAG: AtpZ/AtpI family protein [Bacteroidetes bacterium]|nr:MAG: AtpZ/AtpI family protein [Bacteroidota bacterium]